MSGRPRTLDEAICLCEALSEELQDTSPFKAFNGQLAEWLKELKAYRETYPYGVDRFNGSDTPRDCDKCIWSVCNYNKVEWDADTPQTEQKDVAFEFNGKLWTPKEADTPQTDCDHKCIQAEVGCEQTDCPWK